MPQNHNDDSVRIVNDGTGEHIDVPATLLHDLTTSFNDRAEFNEYLRTVNDDLQRARVNDDGPRLYNDDPDYFQFKYVDNPALYEYDLRTGEYHVDRATLSNYGTRAHDHGGLIDHYRDWCIFDHNPFTCGYGCRPRPPTRPRRRSRPVRSSVAGRSRTSDQG